MLPACESFLDKEPLGMESDASFYTTPEAMDQALAATYDVMTTRDLYEVKDWAFGDVASDDAEAGGQEGGNDLPPMQDINSFIHISANRYCSEWWKELYKGIYRANIVLEKIGAVTMDETLKKQMIAEAKFLRAMYHFDLLKVYGDIPIVDHVLEPSEYKQARKPVSEVLHFIENDLKQAYPDLPLMYGNNDYGRVTKGAAMSLLTKALIFESSYAHINLYPNTQEKWDEALKMAEAVMDLGVYELVHGNYQVLNTTEVPQRTVSAYEYLFTDEGENSPESIFDIQCYNDGFDYYSSSGQGKTVHQMVRDIFVRQPDGSLVSKPGPGWGFVNPTDEFVNEFEKGDPRLHATVAFVGDSLLVSVDGKVEWELYNMKQTVNNRLSKKAVAHPFYQGLQWFQCDLNMKRIRYADLILWAAEASYRLGNNAKAIKYVNMIRERARSCGNTGVPADLNAVTFDDIIHERRVELGLEGHRFFDIVRWGIAGKVLRAQGKPFVDGKHERFPIGEDEIVLSDGVLVQNNGY